MRDSKAACLRCGQKGAYTKYILQCVQRANLIHGLSFPNRNII